MSMMTMILKSPTLADWSLMSYKWRQMIWPHKKKKLSFGAKAGKKKGKVGLVEEEEGSANDYESDSSHGPRSPIYAESGDNSSDDSEGDGEFKFSTRFYIFFSSTDFKYF